MPRSVNKRPVNLDKELVERFEYLYPNIKSIFLNRALSLSLQDKKFFEDVFFNPIFMEIK